MEPAQVHGQFDGRISIVLALLDSLGLYWFLYFGFLSLAYYTNPSEESFRRFLTQLSIQGHHHLNHCPSATHHKPCPSQPSSPSPSPSTSPSTSAPSTKHRSNNRQPPRPPSPQRSKISITLRTPHYNRHNLFLCTLISIDHCSSDSAPPLGDGEPEYESYPQLEWFFGCFGTWWTLERQQPTSSLSLLRSVDSWQSVWNQWFLVGSIFTDSQSIDRLQPASDPSSTKPKKKKTNRPSRKTLPLISPGSIRACPLSESHPFRSAGVNCTDDAFSSWSSLSDHDSCSGQISISPCQSTPIDDDLKTTLALSFEQASHQSIEAHEVAPASNTSGVLETCPNNDVARPPIATGAHEAVTKVRHRSPEPRHAASPPPPSAPERPALMDESRLEPLVVKSPAPVLRQVEEPVPQSIKAELLNSSDDPLDLREVNLQSSPSELENQLSELACQRNQEAVNRLHYQSSLKHLKEIKDLKEFKRLNLDEKLEQFKLLHSQLTKKSAQFQEELEALNVKRSSIQSKFPKHVQQFKREEDRFKAELRKSEAELQQLSKTYEAKKAQKSALQDKLAARKNELMQKREVGRKPAKSKSKPVEACTTNPKPPSQAPEMSPNTSCSSGESCTSSERNTIISSLSSPSDELVQTIETRIAPRSGLPIDYPPPPSQFQDSEPRQTVVDPWAPDPWTEDIHLNNIRDSFTSLPNLERSALTEHFTHSNRLAAIDPTLSSRVVFPLVQGSPVIDDLFKSRQEPHPLPITNFSPDWDQPSNQTASPFGAIGQQGPGSRSSQSSPLTSTPVNALLHATGAVGTGLDTAQKLTTSPAHVSYPIGNGALGRAELLPDTIKAGGLSRTSSSTSLSHLNGFGPAPNATYAAIAAPIQTRFHRLDEVNESSDEGSNHSPRMAWSRVCGRVEGQSGSTKPQQTVEPLFGSPKVGVASLKRSPSGSPSPLNPLMALPNVVDGLGKWTSRVPRSMERTGGSGVRGHHSSQSLGGIVCGRGMALNSIFDTLPDPGCATAKPAASTGLNPAAKAFTFGGSKTKPISAAGGERPAPRGPLPKGSHSVQHSPAHAPLSLASMGDGHEAELQATKVTKTKAAHRISLPEPVDFKRLPPRLPGTAFGGLEERLLATLSGGEYGSTNSSRTGHASARTSPEQSPFLSSALREGIPANPASASRKTQQPKGFGCKAASLPAVPATVGGTEVQNEKALLGTLLSPGEALPVSCTKTACAGLFGPIGAGAHAHSHANPGGSESGKATRTGVVGMGESPWWPERQIGSVAEEIRSSVADGRAVAKIDEGGCGGGGIDSSVSGVGGGGSSRVALFERGG